MAAVAGPRFWQNGGRPMSKTPRPPSITPGTGKVPAPVRVKLKRVSCNHAIPYPPDGQAREWWQRLKDAFGTASSAFVDRFSLNLKHAVSCALSHEPCLMRHPPLCPRAQPPDRGPNISDSNHVIRKSAGDQGPAEGRGT